MPDTATLSPIEVLGSAEGRASEILTPEALAFLADLHQRFDARRRSSPRRPRGAPEALRRRRAAGLPGRNKGGAGRRLAGGADSRRPAGSPRRDHRPGRPQDDHQRPELRGQGVHGRLRGRHVAHLGQPHRGPGQPEGPLGGTAGADRRLDRQGLCAGSNTGRAAGAPARLAPAGAHVRVRRRADVRRAVRFRPLLLPQRQGAARPGQRPLLLPAEDGIHLEARLWNDVFVHAQTASASRRDRSRPRC